MVDVDCRRAIAEGIDRYLLDLIDNFELDDALCISSTEELACVEIAGEMRRFIDDFKRHRYSDAKLRPEL